MSAFMVEDETINRVVTWLTREVSTSPFIIDRLARKYEVDLGSSNWDEKLAQAMFQVEKHLALQIAVDVPEYEKATWG